MLFGVTALMIVVAGLIRSLYNGAASSVRNAELATDMSAGALALAMTVPLSLLCHNPSFQFLANQSPRWIYMVPLLPIAALQVSSRVLSDITGSLSAMTAATNRLQSVAVLTLAVSVVAICSAFVATHTAYCKHN